VIVALSLLMKVDPVTGYVALMIVSVGTDRAEGDALAGPATWKNNAASAVADRRNVAKDLRMLRSLRILYGPPFVTGQYLTGQYLTRA